MVTTVTRIPHTRGHNNDDNNISVIVIYYNNIQYLYTIISIRFLGFGKNHLTEKCTVKIAGCSLEKQKTYLYRPSKLKCIKIGL